MGKDNNYFTVSIPPNNDLENVSFLENLFFRENVLFSRYPNNDVGKIWKPLFTTTKEIGYTIKHPTLFQASNLIVCKTDDSKQCEYILHFFEIETEGEVYVEKDKNDVWRMYDVAHSFGNILENIEETYRIAEQNSFGIYPEAVWICSLKHKSKKPRLFCVVVTKKPQTALFPILKNPKLLTFEKIISIIVDITKIIYNSHRNNILNSLLRDYSPISPKYFVYTEKGLLLNCFTTIYQPEGDTITSSSDGFLVGNMLELTLSQYYTLIFIIRIIGKTLKEDKRLFDVFKKSIKAFLRHHLFLPIRYLIDDHTSLFSQSVIIKKEGKIVEDFLEKIKSFIIPSPYVYGELTDVYLNKDYVDFILEGTPWILDKKIKNPELGILPRMLESIKFGFGSSGVVYKGCRRKDCGEIEKKYVHCDDCSYAIKVTDVPVSDDELVNHKEKHPFEKIADIYKICSENNLSSPLHDWWTIENETKVVLITDSYERTLKTILKDRNISFVEKYAYVCASIVLLNKLHKLKIVHVDAHTKNFMTDRNKKMFVIDLETAMRMKIPKNGKERSKKQLRFLSNMLHDYEVLMQDILSEMSDDVFFMGVMQYYQKIFSFPYRNFFNALDKDATFEKTIEMENSLVRLFIKDIPIPPMSYILK